MGENANIEDTYKPGIIQYADMKLIEFGELIVSGTDEISIELKQRPRRIEVRFADCDVPVPCNAVLEDDRAEGFLVEKGLFRKKYYLVVKWSVSSSRKILWSSYER